MNKLILIICIIFSFDALAQDIDITADNQVEWHQKEQKMIAIGNAKASKKDMSINSNKLIAYYNNANNKKGITKVQADGKVVLTTPTAKATGDFMDYDLQKDEAILTGKPSTIKTANETITAEDNITYYPSKKLAIAKGNVLATSKDGNKIYSQKMIAYFKDSSKGSLELDKVEIFDNVKIITKDAKVTGNEGVYHPQTGLVNLLGDVTIFQNDNQLKGSRAEANLNTGVSRLISGSKGRVTGKFKESQKK